ncbi:MAG: hypothetical protein ABIZ64_15785 [Casimicrobium sp.]
MQKKTLLYPDDIVRSDFRTSLGIELLIGGRVNLKKGDTAKLARNGTFMALRHEEWHKIVLNNGGAWAKFQRVDRPLTIQSHGGMLGIKG